MALKPILRLRIRRRHDTRIVHEDIEPVAPFQELRSSRANRGERVVVHEQKLDAAGLKERGACSLAFLEVAGSKKNTGACCGEGTAGLDANA